MHIKDYINPAELARHIESGHVLVKHHNDWPLDLYTYARKCQYDDVWNPVTTKTRGLIVNRDTGEVIARPFEKWFNYGDSSKPDTWPENLPKGEPAITKKLDGNLITLYPWEGRWYAASKGSFHSEHADWANEWLADRPQYWSFGWTPVCEMVAESVQHHIVHYGEGHQGLYLLAMVWNDTGEELDDPALLNGWGIINGMNVNPTLDVRMECALKANNKNEEGYVLAWPRAGQPPFRVKVKFVEFLRLQKLLHNTGPKQILDMLRYPHLQCYLTEALDVERSTPEFVEWVQGWIDKLRGRYNEIEAESQAIYSQAWEDLLDAPRKEYAERFKTRPNTAVLFAMLDKDNTKTANLIWKAIEPMTEGNRPFTTDEE